jgi:hypothetical protein
VKAWWKRRHREPAETANAQAQNGKEFRDI